MKILLTGATGYIGGRLAPRLIEAGHDVTVLVRDPDRLRDRPWFPQCRAIRGDLLKRGDDNAAVGDASDGWAAQLESYDAVYYLVHSMAATGREDFRKLDRTAAKNFANAILAANPDDQPPLCIFLGGLLPPREPSAHLLSRAETGEVLVQYLPTTEFRAGPVIGSGSASFEMVRYLTERLPVMVTPKWIETKVTPVAVRNVLQYLQGGLAHPALGIVQIGADTLTFKQMMLTYAELRGLKRRIYPLPVMTPKLAGRWVGAVTPIPNRLALPLVEGLLQPLVADTTRAHECFPEIEPFSYHQSVKLALEKIRLDHVETRWTGALAQPKTVELHDSEGAVKEVRTRRTQLPREALFGAFSSLGGEKGWLAWDWAWELRGLFDALIGGPGLRRGRRHPTELLAGETVDFWRVERVDPPERLILRAEMKVPGRAWLTWEVCPDEDGHSNRLVQSAIFHPQGLFGTLYWYAMYPAHQFIFDAMIDGVIKEATEREQQKQP
ncbi:MAG: SDR family oxidoreductase [Opitutales bacterium]